MSYYVSCFAVYGKHRDGSDGWGIITHLIYDSFIDAQREADRCNRQHEELEYKVLQLTPREISNVVRSNEQRIIIL